MKRIQPGKKPFEDRYRNLVPASARVRVQRALSGYHVSSKTHRTAFEVGFLGREVNMDRSENPYNEKGYRGAWFDGWSAADALKGAK